MTHSIMEVALNRLQGGGKSTAGSFGALLGGLCLLFSAHALAVDTPPGPEVGAPTPNARHWVLWLAENANHGKASVLTSASSLSLTTSSGDSVALQSPIDAAAQKWVAGPASLPWTDLALQLIVKYQQNPLRAARVLAHLHAAISDAIVRLAATSTAQALQAIAVHAAASAVLAHFYPRESPGRIEATGIGVTLAVAAAGQVSPEDLAQAREVGRRAAADAISRALDDGGDAIWNPADRPAVAPSMWRAAPPLNLHNPTEPLARKWRTWVLADDTEVEVPPPPPPPPFGSERYWKEASEVLEVSRALTAEQKRIADEWNLDQGSVTPPGVWNRKAMSLITRHGMGTAAAARVLAALNVAMSDALVACWQAKFKHWTVRPVNVIRDKLDAHFVPYLLTPPFPGYVSGHAATSGAAAEVLAAFFPEYAADVQASADEAAMSRLYGGIHFRSDNDEGLRLGREVGRRVAKRSHAQPG